MQFDLFSLADEAPKPPVQNLPNATETRTKLDSPSTAPRAIDNHALAFVAACKSAGLTDPALKPVTVSAIGRCDYDVVELSRLANELLRGVRSDRPELTPARWQAAGEAARQKFGRWHVSCWKSGVLVDRYAYRGFEAAAASSASLRADGGAWVYTVELCTMGNDCSTCSEMIRREIAS